MASYRKIKNSNLKMKNSDKEENLIPVAERSKSTVPFMIYGIIWFCIMFVVVLIAKPDYWYLYLVATGVICIICVVVMVRDLKRPKTIIGYDSENLFIWKKNRWVTIKINDVVKITYWHNQSSRITLKSGAVEFTFTTSAGQNLLVVYNIADIESVYKKLSEICGLPE